MIFAFALLCLISLNATAQTASPFVTTWVVGDDNFGDGDLSITIPTTTAFTNYSYTVNWGDNNMDTGLTGDTTHIYTTSGTYEVSITGTFPAIYFNNLDANLNTNDESPEVNDANKIQTIKQWGTNPWASMENAFAGCSNLNIEPGAGNPVLSGVTDMSRIFQGTGVNSDISGWDVSSVTNMEGMFEDATAFNSDLSRWNVSSVTNMKEMFDDATNFNRNLSAWDVSSVTDMLEMFEEATDFNGDISGWDVSSVTDMSEMFKEAVAFNQDISSWDVSSVTNMEGMFEDAVLSTANYDALLVGWSTIDSDEGDLQSGVVFDGGDSQYCTAGAAARNMLTGTPNGWRITDGGVDMDCPDFLQLTSFVTTWVVGDNNFGNGDLTITIPTNDGFADDYDYTVNWGDGRMDPDLTGDAEHTYASAGTYEVSITGIFPAIYFDANDDANKILTIKQWGTNPWVSMAKAFAGCSNLNIEPGAGNPVLSGVMDMSGMFEEAVAFNSDLSGWDVSSVTNMSGMFEEAVAFNSDLSGWDVSSVTDMEEMFEEATVFNSNLSRWNVSSVTDMRSMFEEATAFNQNISDWNVRSVTDMGDMFEEATAFNGDLSRWDVSSVTDMRGMFTTATSFVSDISDWDVSIVTDMSEMFAGAVAFNQDISDWDVSSVRYMSGMFEGVTLSTANYDALLVGWSTIDSDESTLQTTVTFSGGNSRYCTAGAAARNVLTSTPNNWIITDDGVDMSEDCANFLQPTFFVTTWVVGNANFGDGDLSITIPTNPDFASSYSYTVNWGDGNMDIGLTGDTTHIYTIASTYTVSITGTFPAIYFNNGDDDDDDDDFNDDDDDNDFDDDDDFFDDDDANKILTIKQWGTNPWASMENAFSGCSKLNIEPGAGNPVLSSVTNMSYMFQGAETLNGNLSDWDVSNVTDMEGMFEEAEEFNGDLSGWNVSSVTDMEEMFAEAVAFNSDISGWNVSNVTDMEGMFEDAVAFNGDLSGWKVSRVTNMSEMFAEAVAFNSDISGWDVSRVTNMSEMFAETEEFNGNLSGWDVGRVRNMEGMFRDAFLSTENYDALLVGWSTIDSDESVLQTTVTFSGGSSQYCTAGAAARNVLTSTPNNWIITDGGVDMSADCANFLQPTFFVTTWVVGDANFGDGDLSITIPTNPDFASSYSYTVNWGDGNIDAGLTSDTTHSYTTSGTYTVSITGTFPAIYFNSGDGGGNLNNDDANKIQTIKQWGTNPWASMENAFSGCSNLNIEHGAGNPVLSGVTNMSGMFTTATVFNSNISDWDVRSVTNMSGMFEEAAAFNQDISGWNVSGVIDMSAMFENAATFNSDLSDWNVSSVMNMRAMFEESVAFNQNISDWYVSNVTNMSGMFTTATSFISDISDWDVSNVTDMSGMFKGAIVFNSDLSDWNVRNVTNMSEMFAGAIAFNQNISDWDVSNVTNMSGMFRDVTLSTANYDTLLVGWSTIDSDESTLQTSVTFSGGNSQYCTAGTAARNVLTGTTNSWTITDGGVDMSGICDEVTFGSGSIADQTYHVGDDVDFILPKAALGTPPYSYALDGEIPAGLAFDTTMRALIGTPAAETDAVELTYMVTDSSTTATTDTLRFTVTIIDDLILRIKVFLEGAQ